MEADGEIELLAQRPDRVVDRVAELLAVDARVRPHEDADQAELLGLFDHRQRARHVLLRDDGDAEQARRRVAAVLGDPVVVGAAPAPRRTRRRRKPGRPSISVGIDDRLLDVVDRHLLEPRLGIERAGLDLGVLELAGGGAHALFLRHAAGAGDRQVVGGRRVAAVVHDLAAVRLGLEVEDPVAKLRRRVLQHRRRMLEHVAVGVDDPGAVRWPWDASVVGPAVPAETSVGRARARSPTVAVALAGAAGPTILYRLRRRVRHRGAEPRQVLRRRAERQLDLLRPQVVAVHAGSRRRGRCRRAGAARRRW